MCSHPWPLKLILIKHKVVAMAVNSASNVDIAAKKLLQPSSTDLHSHQSFRVDTSPSVMVVSNDQQSVFQNIMMTQ